MAATVSTAYMPDDGRLTVISHHNLTPMEGRMDSPFSSIELLGDVVKADPCDRLQEWIEWVAFQIALKRASILRHAKAMEPDIDFKLGLESKSHNWNNADSCWCNHA